MPTGNIGQKIDAAVLISEIFAAEKIRYPLGLKKIVKVYWQLESPRLTFKLKH